MSTILVTGATGYIGSRLTLFLASQGHTVRAFVRNPDWISRYSSRFPSIQICVGDVSKPETLAPYLDGIDCAVYLVHSIGATGDFMAEEHRCAVGFASQMNQAKVPKIVYLGGLANEDDGKLSDHLQSRLNVGYALRKYHPMVMEIRASIILGSGSISFELIRSLVDRLPVMLVPKWVTQPTQPLFIDDLIHYLALVIENQTLTASSILEVGGPEPVTYMGLMLEYAEQKGLRRWMLPVPLLTPWLSSLWLGLVTPIFARIGRKLIEGLRNPSVVRTRPQLAFESPPISYQDAIRRILQGAESTSGAWWYQARSSIGELPPPPTRPRIFQMGASRQISASPDQIMAVLRHMGGHRGYFFANWIWVLRGWMDLLMGGVGHTRTKGRDDAPVLIGDVIDWWRVVQMVPDQRLTLQAEMKLSGIATLDFEVRPLSKNQSTVTLTAGYTTSSYWGRVYWIILFPVHYILFRGFLRGVERRVIYDAPDIPRGSSPPHF